MKLAGRAQPVIKNSGNDPVYLLQYYDQKIETMEMGDPDDQI